MALFGFHALLKFTRLGKAMRATATNPELAQACSIDMNTVIRAVWFIGTAFAALGECSLPGTRSSIPISVST